MPAEVFEAVRELREARGAVWGINTGRSMAQMTEGFLESRFPFLPDWVVAREREIYFPNEFGRWVPHKKWNKRCGKEIHRLFKRAGKLLRHLRKEVEEHTGARWLEMDGEPAGMVSRTEEEMEWIVNHIGPMVAEMPALSWQRNSIYLRFGHRDFQKGSSLSEVAGLIGVGRDGRFAMGDSHNDLEMLDPAHAGMIACPGNAVAEIRATVEERGGYVAERAHGAGALEALEHFFGIRKGGGLI